LTIIFQAPSFWIELIDIDISSLATGAGAVSAVTPTKQGNLIGYSCCISPTDVDRADLLNTQMRLASDAEIVLPAAVGATFETLTRNETGSTVEAQICVLLFMRKPLGN